MAERICWDLLSDAELRMVVRSLNYGIIMLDRMIEAIELTRREIRDMCRGTMAKPNNGHDGAL